MMWIRKHRVTAHLLCLGLWVALAVFGQAGSVSAQDGVELTQAGTPRRGNEVARGFIKYDAHATMGWYLGAGVGARVGVPVVPRGFVENLDDDLMITAGFDAFYFFHPDHPGVGVFPVVAAQWNFYINHEWSVFPEVGAALLFAPGRNRFFRVPVGPHMGAGARWALSDSIELMMRVSWPAGAQIGVSFWSW